MSEIKKTVRETLHSKYLGVSLTVYAMLMALTVSAFAAEGDPTSMDSIATSLTASFTSTAGDILKMVGIGAVAAIGVIGVKVAVKTGINFFKSLASK